MTSAMHKVTDSDRQAAVEELVGEMILSLADHMDMTVPSAVYAVQQVTARHLAAWDKGATVKNLRATARFINGDIKYAELWKIQEKQFDMITAGYDRQNGATSN